MHIAPRFLTLPGDGPLEASHPVRFDYTYKPQELAKKKTSREPIIIMNSTVCDVGGHSDPALVHILAFRPRVNFSIQCPAVRISNERENMRNHINDFLHGKYTHKADLIIPESIYASSLSASVKDASACLLEVRVFRSLDARPWLLTKAIEDFASNCLNIASPEVKMISGEREFKSLRYTDISAANSFKHVYDLNSSSEFHVDESAGGFHELEPKDGLRMLYVNESQLKPVPVSRERILSFFENPEPLAFDHKVLGGSVKRYTAQDMRKRDAQQAQRMGPGLARAYELHTSEFMKRITWNFLHGKHPAHEHLHLCEAMDQDDANFFFGIPPFHKSDGSVNPLGIPDNKEIDSSKHALE